MSNAVTSQAKQQIRTVKAESPVYPHSLNGCTALCVKGQWRHCLKIPCSGARPQPACGPAPALHFLTERDEGDHLHRKLLQTDILPAEHARYPPSRVGPNETPRPIPQLCPAAPHSRLWARLCSPGRPAAPAAGRGPGRLSWARPGRGRGGWAVLREWCSAGNLSRF